MLYILAGITGIGLLACAAELLGRAADHIGITDRLFKLFDLPAEKETAPAVGATEAEKENTSIPSIQGDGEKVKILLIIEENGDGRLTGKICAKSIFDLVHLYKVAKRMFESTAKKSGASLAFLDFAEKNLACETEVITP